MRLFFQAAFVLTSSSTLALAQTQVVDFRYSKSGSDAGHIIESNSGSDVERIIALEKSDSHVMEHLDHLTNRIGPRLTGSHGFHDACAWARDEFESFGLKNCHLEQWGEFPVGFNRGPSSGRMTAPEAKELHFGTNAWTAGTHGPTSGVVVMAPTNDDELAAVRSKLKGAWVFVPSMPPPGGARPPRNPANPPVEARANEARPGSTTPTAPTANAGEVAKSGEAKPSEDRPIEAGAVARGGARPDATTPAGDGGSGARGNRDRNAGGPPRDGATAAADRAFREKLDKVYDEEGIAGLVRSTRNELILTGGSSKIAYDKLPTRPSINLLATEFKEIAERVKNGETVSLQFDIRNWFEKGPIALDNVIAEIPGSEKPDEIVIVGGHLDSWDGATGATDNGTGVATTMEVARLLVKAGVHPKRTIRFMLWGGEEEGLLGSAAYVKKHKDEMAKVSAVLVHDMGTNYCDGIPALPPMVKTLEEIFAPVKDLDPEMPFKVREVKQLPSPGSDHQSFLPQSVPGFIWDQKGKNVYNHVHHTQYDTYDAAIPEYQRNSATVIAIGALGIANLPEMLPREGVKPTAGGGGFGGGRRLGVQLSDDMKIEEVVEGGIAEKAGMKVGDKIVKIGTSAVADSDEMRSTLADGPRATKVIVLRDGKETEFAVEFPLSMTERIGLRFGDGLTISEITKDGAAEKAGLKVGDKVVKIGDTAVEATRDLFGALSNANGAQSVIVSRDGKEVAVTLAIPERQ